MKKSKEDMYEGCIGSRINMSQLNSWIETLVDDNLKHSENGTPRWCGNVWGKAGSGKTAIVKSFANKKTTFKGKEYEGFEIIDIPLAQIEEVGELHGLPETFVEMEFNGSKEWIMKDFVDVYASAGWKPTGTAPQMRYAPPKWVPKEERPGIILFDDGNRASPRILKGMMQLIQDYRTISWSIPDGWTILFTGNPDTAEYSVTTQDSAQITRMRHVTLKMDIKGWVAWATENGIDARGIGFALKYPEMIENGGERTNLRTYTEFCNCLKRYPDTLNADLRNQLIIDGNSLLDEAVVSTFMVFMEKDMKLVIDPELILNEPEKAIQKVKKLMSGEEPRVDIVSVTANRLLAYLISPNYVVKKEHITAFQDFMTCSAEDKNGVPEDIAQCIMRQMVLSKSRNDLVPFVKGNKIIYNWVLDSIKNANLLN
jgi:hypothetical protein